MTDDPTQPPGSLHSADAPAGQSLWPLVVGAIGVVYGDIGTSPLYAMRECFRRPHGLEPVEANVLGVLSLVFWSLTIIISIKYLLIVLRADNRGEGGILALMVLATRNRGRSALTAALTGIGIFGAALLFGDGAITPAISVLSAVEGLRVAAPIDQSHVVMISLAILVALFAIQRHGTHRIGLIFGPFMLVWFAVLAVLGVTNLVREPRVLEAINPLHALRLITSGEHGFLILGTVFLTVTGGEALYADLGHFGKKPIRWGWYGVAMPSLLLNYFGQGALLLRSPGSTDNLFYHLAPSWGLYPLVALATAATVIASQAIITGSFSLARQAVQLGLWPRVQIAYTSSHLIGQVYVPLVNWGLLGVTIALVAGFGESGGLASAYGVAISATMFITTLLLLLSCRRLWPARQANAMLAALLAFLFVDGLFFSSNCAKILSAGWIPIVLAAAIYLLATTWRHGREITRRSIQPARIPLADFAESLKESKPTRVPGTAVFLSAEAGVVPRSLLHNYKHNLVLHERTILLSVVTEEVPTVPDEGRLQIRSFGNGIHSVYVKYGFSQHPDVPQALRQAVLDGQGVDVDRTSFFLSKETLVLRKRSDMHFWRRHLFAFLARNALDPSLFFNLPPNLIVELGMQVEI